MVIVFCVGAELCAALARASLSSTRFGFLGQTASIPATEAASPALGQGDTRQSKGGDGGKKKTYHLFRVPPSTPIKMNKNWKTNSKVRLIREHLQYADVFFCTLCLLNCL